MIDTYYVIAGNHSEYTEFTNRKLKENSKQEFIEVTYYGHNLTGIRNPKGFLIGTWKQRRDIKDLLFRLMSTYSPNYGVPAAIIESYGLVCEL